MADLIRLNLFFTIVVLAPAVFFLPRHLVNSSDDKDNLLQGINSYRTSLNLPTLTKNKNAACLADQIADDLEDQPCPTSHAVPTPQPQLANNKYLRKCKIDVNSTTDGVIMPACVSKLVPTLVLTNYTRTPYARYLNNSRYTGIGVGSKDDWTVVVLTTSSYGGSFSNGGVGGLVKEMGLGFYLVLLLGWLVSFAVL